jgi:hypothetical protein
VGDVPGNETDDAGGQQQGAKATKHPTDDLAQSAARRRRYPVRAELPSATLCLGGVEAGLRRDRQATERLIDGHVVPIEVGQV